MAEPLKVLYVVSELSPLVSTGGLGDVAYALPRALHAQGHDVRLALPCYDIIPPEYRGREYCLCVARLGSRVVHGCLRESAVPETDIPLYLIEHHEYFSRGDLYGYGTYEYVDNAARFCFFSLAVLDGVPQLDWKPDIIHCHDWHTAAIPAYLKTRDLRDPSWRDLPTLLTMHNLNYQGRYPASCLPQTGLGPELFTPEYIEFYGDINLMKAGIAFATKLNTVSPRYAQEILTPEFGAGLNGFLNTRKDDLAGILNGVDYTTWNAATDPLIDANYTMDDLTPKVKCKAALQRVVGLPERDVPVFAMVTRISWQKGVDILLEAVDDIMENDVQLLILGAGDPFYEQVCRDTAARHPGKMAAIMRFDVPLSHKVEAGSDFFLMPSRYEPCGLSQMYSLAYATVPIVSDTGGLADSIRHISKDNLARGVATGIVFSPCAAPELVGAIHAALKLYTNPERLHAVRMAGMREDFSWAHAAEQYVKLYREAIAKCGPLSP